MCVHKQGITIQTCLKHRVETDVCTHTRNHHPNMFETQNRVETDACTPTSHYNPTSCRQKDECMGTNGCAVWTLQHYFPCHPCLCSMNWCKFVWGNPCKAIETFFHRGFLPLGLLVLDAFLSFCRVEELGEGFGCVIFPRLFISWRNLQLSPLEHCPLRERIVLGKGAKVLIRESAQGTCPPHHGRRRWRTREWKGRWERRWTAKCGMRRRREY